MPTADNPDSTKSRTYDGKRVSIALAVLGVALLVVRLVAMAYVPLMDTTESRYGDTARRMAESGDWITPWYTDNVPFWGKPPLMFWTSAFGINVLGKQEIASRLPHLLLAIVLLAVTMRIARRRNPVSVVPTACILGSSVLFWTVAGSVVADIALALGCALTFDGVHRALMEGEKRSRAARIVDAVSVVAGFTAGLLSKGPVALALTIPPILLWAIVNRQGKALFKNLPWIAIIVATAAATCPWYILAEQKTPGFLDYFLIGEHWRRFVIPKWTSEYGDAHEYPIGTIVMYAFVGTLPWSVLLPVAAAVCRRSLRSPSRVAEPAMPGPERLFFLFWAMAPVALFLPARNILSTYMLPGLPAFAILFTDWFQHRLGDRITRRWVAAGLAFVVLIGTIATVSLLTPAQLDRYSVKRLVQAYATVDNDRDPANPWAHLVFLDNRPFSGSYYTDGQARIVTVSDFEMSRFGTSTVYLVVQPGPATDSALRRIESIGHGTGLAGKFGRYQLWSVDPIVGSPPVPDRR